MVVKLPQICRNTITRLCSFLIGLKLPIGDILKIFTPLIIRPALPFSVTDRVHEAAVAFVRTLLEQIDFISLRVQSLGDEDVACLNENFYLKGKASKDQRGENF